MQQSHFNARIPKDIKQKLLGVRDRTSLDLSLLAMVGIDLFLSLPLEEQSRKAAEASPARRVFRPMEQINTRWDEEFMVSLARRAGMAGLSQVVVVEVGIADFLDQEDADIMAAVREWLAKNEVQA